MNIVRDDEVGPVVDAGVAIAWNPANYLNYGIGAQARTRVPEFFRKGVSVGFSADVAKVWGYGEQSLIGYLAVREKGDYLSPEDVLEMIDQRGPRGRPGGQHRQPRGGEEGGHRDPAAGVRVAAGARRHSQPGLRRPHEWVDTVIVDGRPVIEGGVLRCRERAGLRARRTLGAHALRQARAEARHGLARHPVTSGKASDGRGAVRETRWCRPDHDQPGAAPATRLTCGRARRSWSAGGRSRTTIRSASRIVTGAGDKAFCAGFDFKEKQVDGRPNLEDFSPRLGTKCSVTKPLIAAVNGPAVAAGMALVEACDLCVAADGAWFALSEVTLGISVENFVQSLWNMPQKILMELLVTGEPLSARRCVRARLRQPDRRSRGVARSWRSRWPT